MAERTAEVTWQGDLLERVGDDRAASAPARSQRFR